MARTWTSQRSGSWSVLSNDAGGLSPWDDNGTQEGYASVPGAIADDTVVIAAGHEVLMDYTVLEGLVDVTIASHASAPGMLYWKDGTSGVLLLAAGGSVAGNSTSATCKGRLLANESGLWTASTASATFLASQSGISGSVSAGNVFTPTTSPAWVVDALIGDSVTINGTTYVISDNDATTATLTSGPGALTVTSWSLVVRPLPVARIAEIRYKESATAVVATDSTVKTQYLDCALYPKNPTLPSVRVYGQVIAECVVSDSGGALLLTLTGLGAAFTANMLVRVSAGTGALPVGLVAGTDYWVKTATANTITLAASSGGSAIAYAAGGPINVHCGKYDTCTIGTGGDANKVLRTYHNLANGTAITLVWTGTAPTINGVTAVLGETYYVVSTAVATGFQIAGVSGGTALTITGTPTTLIAYTGTAGAAPGVGGGTFLTTSAMVNVMDDVSIDAAWGATASSTFAVTLGLSAVVLADVGPENYDQQRVAMIAKTASTLTLSAAVDSAQYPNARIYLMSRNVSIRSTCTTAINIVSGSSNTTGGIFGEIRSVAGTATTFYGYGIIEGTSHIATTISGCGSGISSGTSNIVTTISGCSNGIYSGTSHIATTISGCSNGIYYGTSCTATTISGCSHGIYRATSCTATTISGCSNGINYGASCTVTTISGCGDGIYFGLSCTATTISGCGQGISYGANALRGATLSGNTYDLYASVTTLYGSSCGSTTPAYRINQTYVPYKGGNPFGSVIYDVGANNGAYQAWNQGGVITYAAYSEGTHGDLQACGWVSPDPDWMHTSTFNETALPVGAVMCPLWIDFPIQAIDGETITCEVAIKPSTTSGWSSAPRAQLVDAGMGWNSSGTFAEVISEDAHTLGDTTWELQTITHVATAAQSLILRIVGTRTAIGAANFLWCWRQKLAAGGGVYINTRRNQLIGR